MKYILHLFYSKRKYGTCLPCSFPISHSIPSSISLVPFLPTYFPSSQPPSIPISFLILFSIFKKFKALEVMYGRDRQYVLSEKIVHDSVKRLQQLNIKNSRYRPWTLNSVIISENDFLSITRVTDCIIICLSKNDLTDTSHFLV